MHAGKGYLVTVTINVQHNDEIDMQHEPFPMPSISMQARLQYNVFDSEAGSEPWALQDHDA